MKLTLNKFHVQDIQFAEASSFCSGVLYINKAELAEYLMEDTNIRSVDFDIARPGESVRIVPIKDVVQPRFKQSGSGQVFPGFVGDVETVGNGETNVLEDCAVATSGKIVAFQEGIIDMSGPGAEFNSFSKMNILVPLIYPVEGLLRQPWGWNRMRRKYLNMRAFWKWDRSIRICPRLYMWIWYSARD